MIFTRYQETRYTYVNHSHFSQQELKCKKSRSKHYRKCLKRHSCRCLMWRIPFLVWHFQQHFWCCSRFWWNLFHSPREFWWQSARALISRSGVSRTTAKHTKQNQWSTFLSVRSSRDLLKTRTTHKLTSSSKSFGSSKQSGKTVIRFMQYTSLSSGSFPTCVLCLISSSFHSVSEEMSNKFFQQVSRVCLLLSFCLFICLFF